MGEKKESMECLGVSRIAVHVQEILPIFVVTGQLQI